MTESTKTFYGPFSPPRRQRVRNWGKACLQLSKHGLIIPSTWRSSGAAGPQAEPRSTPLVSIAPQVLTRDQVLYALLQKGGLRMESVAQLCGHARVQAMARAEAYLCGCCWPANRWLHPGVWGLGTSHVHPFRAGPSSYYMTPAPHHTTNQCRGVWGPGGGGGRVWHKASVFGCVPLVAPIGLSALLILTLCGSERVLVVSTEPPDDLGLRRCNIWNGEIWCGANLAPILKSHYKMWYKIPRLWHRSKQRAGMLASGWVLLFPGGCAYQERYK